MRFLHVGIAFGMIALPASASGQALPASSIQELAASPVIRLSLAETLRSPPDEATLTVGSQARAATATAAAAANKVKTTKLLQTIRAQGIRERDIQTQGLQLQSEYQWENVPSGPSRQKFAGYLAANTIRVKTTDIPALTKLLDVLAAAGVDTVYGPTFGISDPAPLRREARKRALARGEAEALEYARNQGFARVTLLSIEEGTSYRGTDAAVLVLGPPPPPPPPAPGASAPERDGGSIAPGQLEAGVTVNLLYRMER